MAKIKLSREFYDKWLLEALGCKTGEAVLIPCDSKSQQGIMFKYFELIIKRFSVADPVTASRLDLIKRVEMKRYWIAIKMLPLTPTVGFKQCADGSKIKINILEASERSRRIKLMYKDGLTIGEARKMAGPLTEEEEALWTKV